MKPGTNTLFVNEIGEDSYEEVDNVVKGGNYGWPTVEGPSNDLRYIPPIYSYAHNGASASITGGLFYTGTSLGSQYTGKYFFADYNQDFIRVLDPATGQATTFATGADRPIDLSTDSKGNLYYASILDATFNSNNRSVYKISYVGTANRNPSAVASADVNSGLTTLTVHFSALGSSDPDGDPITYSWNFGDGTPAAAGRDVVHDYTVAGTYQAVVTVSDNRGVRQVRLRLRSSPAT